MQEMMLVSSMFLQPPHNCIAVTTAWDELHISA
jgi:hypothetical protein